MTSLLLTGASGFIGRQLVPRLVKAYPGSRITAASGPGRAATAPEGVVPVSVDLEDAQATLDMVRQAEPDLVIHLAAQSSVADSINSPWPVWRGNVFGTVNLAEAVKTVRPDANFVFASTAEVYGRAFSDGRTLDETSPLAPANPYARSKAACEYALQDLWSPEGKLVILRIFNHIGAGQDERFVASTFAAQIARMEAAQAPLVMKVGDLSVERDFGDVRDLIDAIVATVASLDRLPSRNTFNVCTARPRPVQAILDGLLAQATVVPQVEIDPGRLRPGELRRVAASNDAISLATGWRPSRDLGDTLSILLNDWRNRVAARSDLAGA